jgi:hypothetical protein
VVRVDGDPYWRGGFGDEARVGVAAIGEVGSPNRAVGAVRPVDVGAVDRHPLDIVADLDQDSLGGPGGQVVPPDDAEERPVEVGAVDRHPERRDKGGKRAEVVVNARAVEDVGAPERVAPMFVQ